MVYNSIRDLYKFYDSFLLDMYGVLYNGSCLYDGALDLLQEMKTAGKRIVILSNATLISKIAMQNYEKFGMQKGIHYDDFITSGEVFSKTVEKNFAGARYHQIFKQNSEIFATSNLVQSNSIKDADFIYVGTVMVNGKQINLNDLTDCRNIPVNIDNLFRINWTDIQQLQPIQKVLEQCLKYNKKLVVANPDIFAIEKNSPVICQGGIGEYYEYIGGEVMYFGKPYKPIYDYAKAFIKGKTAMVGDTPWTDILGGNMAGIDTILTMTGVSAAFVQRMPGKFSMSDCMHALLTNVSERMVHKSLKEFSKIPTHIVKQFADRNI